MDENGTGTWWVHIVPAPSSFTTREEALRKAPAAGDAALGMLPSWTQFDSSKADFSLKIITHASAFLRVRAAVLIEHGLNRGTAAGGGLLAVDLQGVVTAFRICSEILRKRMRLPSVNGAIQGSVSRYLHSIIENLACVIHDVIVSAAGDDELGQMAAVVDQFVDEACLHQTSVGGAIPFIVQVARVVQERIARARTRVHGGQ